MNYIHQLHFYIQKQHILSPPKEQVFGAMTEGMN